MMLYEALFVPPGGEPLPLSVLDRPDIARYVSGFGTLPGDVGRVAESDGRHIGAAWVRLLLGNDRGYGWVDDDTPELSVAVDPAWCSNGVGTALLEDLLAEVPRVSLSVDVRNPAVRLYQRLGFEALASEGTSVTMLRPR